MKPPNREIKLTKEEAKSSLEAPFWNQNQKIDKNSEFHKMIEKLCEGVFDNNKWKALTNNVGVIFIERRCKNVY